VLVFPPKFKNRNQAFEERVKELTENKALYYSYDDQNLAYRNKLFYGDASHLRTNGALLFSQELANFLRAQNKINQQ
jgi:poly-D-alanine transfer protein DltD